MMEWLEVRCCCVPEKLLGYLQVPVDAKTIAIAQFDQEKYESGSSAETCSNLVYLPVDWVQQRDRRWRAIKAEGMEKEDFKKVPGFVPA